MAQVSARSRSILSITLILLLGLGLSGSVDRYATQHAKGLFANALPTYAVARGLNGIISVAQGTEIAVQPVGVGLTIRAGEILDPLNDLIERFSLLVLVACASLGVQLLLTEMFGSPWVSALLALATVGALLALWRPAQPGRNLLLRLCAAALFLRFAVAGVTLLAALLNQAFLAERQDAALADINTVSTTLKTNSPPPDLAAAEASAAEGAGVLDRLSEFFDGQRRSFDVEARLARMQEQAETATAALVNLIVIFVMQTIVLPIGLLWGAFALLRYVIWPWFVPGPPQRSQALASSQ